MSLATAFFDGLPSVDLNRPLTPFVVVFDRVTGVEAVWSAGEEVLRVVGAGEGEVMAANSRLSYC